MNKNNLPVDSPAMYIGYLSRDLKQHYEARLKPCRLTGSLYFYLLTIQMRGGCTLVELSRSLNVDKAYVSRTIDRLETFGYVERSRHPDDARSCLLHLTAQGERVMEELPDLFDSWNQELSEAFTEDEYKTFLALLEKGYRARLEKKL